MLNSVSSRGINVGQCSPEAFSFTAHRWLQWRLKIFVLVDNIFKSQSFQIKICTQTHTCLWLFCPKWGIWATLSPDSWRQPWPAVGQQHPLCRPSPLPHDCLPLFMPAWLLPMQKSSSFHLQIQHLKPSGALCYLQITRWISKMSENENSSF